MGIFMANIAELVLFVDASNDDTPPSFVSLLFLSLTMQFTLQVDSLLISAAQADKLEDVVDMISADHLFDNGAGVGETGLSCLPAEITAMINGFGRFSTPVSTLTLFPGLGLSMTLGGCI
jgi:hypothetical protein